MASVRLTVSVREPELSVTNRRDWIIESISATVTPPSRMIVNTPWSVPNVAIGTKLRPEAGSPRWPRIWVPSSLILRPVFTDGSVSTMILSPSCKPVTSTKAPAQLPLPEMETASSSLTPDVETVFRLTSTLSRRSLMAKGTAVKVTVPNCGAVGVMIVTVIVRLLWLPSWGLMVRPSIKVSTKAAVALALKKIVPDATLSVPICVSPTITLLETPLPLTIETPDPKTVPNWIC